MMALFAQIITPIIKPEYHNEHGVHDHFVDQSNLPSKREINDQERKSISNLDLIDKN